MFEVGQKYRILKPFYTDARDPEELEDLVGTCIEIVGVCAGEAWFNEYDNGQRDWLFPSDLKDGNVELVEEEEDILEKRLKEIFTVEEKYLNSKELIMYLNTSYEYCIFNNKSRESIVISKNQLEHLAIAIMYFLEDK